MLQELIRAIAEGQAHSQIELAGRLGVSEGLVEQMLEDLVRMGYLTPLEAGCASQCAACPLAKICIVGRPRRAWVLTEKGQKAAMGVTRNAQEDKHGGPGQRAGPQAPAAHQPAPLRDSGYRVEGAHQADQRSHRGYSSGIGKRESAAAI